MPQKKKLVILSGAGVSAESGIKTYRDEDGLWEGHDVTKVASPQGWQEDPAMVLEFYNQRRRNMLNVSPNEGHKALVRLDEHFETCIITQNIDDLHERAGSQRVLHLHGEISKVRSVENADLVYDWGTKDLNMGDTGEDGAQLRPHIVWFGEDVPMIHPAIMIASLADILLIVGTSMVVYPANTLVDYAPDHAKIFLVDPKAPGMEVLADYEHIKEGAGTGLPKLVDRLIAEYK